jgi:hypothetical protein
MTTYRVDIEKYVENITIKDLLYHSEEAHAQGALIQAGIQTVGQLLGYEISNVENLPGIGNCSVEAIKKALINTFINVLAERKLFNDPEYCRAAYGKIISDIFLAIAGREKHHYPAQRLIKSLYGFQDGILRTVDELAVAYPEYSKEMIKTSIAETHSKIKTHASKAIGYLQHDVQSWIKSEAGSVRLKEIPEKYHDSFLTFGQHRFLINLLTALYPQFYLIKGDILIDINSGKMQ